MLKWILYIRDELEKKKALRLMLMSPENTIDPVQQRIVNETVQQRCASVGATRQTQHGVVNRSAVRDDHLQFNNNVDADTSQSGSTHPHRQMAAFAESRPWMSDSTRLVQNITASVEHIDASHTNQRATDLTGGLLASTVPSFIKCASSDSSDIVLSSLHSSERSNVSVHGNHQSRDQQTDASPPQQLSLRSGAEESSSDCSDSIYSTASDTSSSDNVGSDEHSDDSSNYSFPSSARSGADMC